MMIQHDKLSLTLYSNPPPHEHFSRVLNHEFTIHGHTIPVWTLNRPQVHFFFFNYHNFNFSGLLELI